MNEEKMKILKMLEEGRISASDAARLLESCGGGTSSPRPGESRSNNRPTSTARESGFEDLASDISRKFESLARDMEPRLQKFTEIVAEKTATVADRLSKTLSPDEPRSSGTPAPSSFGGESLLEIPVASGYNELNIAGLNGNVTIKGYNGDKITARIFAKPKRHGASVEILRLGAKYTLHYDEDLFDRVSVDAFVPETLFQNISISTINGNLDVTTLQGNHIAISNSNGNTLLQNLTAETIQADCNNGSLELRNLYGTNGQFENFNGDISVADIDIGNLRLSGLNGSTTLLLRVLNRYGSYAWAVETSNGRLTANLPTAPELGYHIKAQAALNQVKIGLTGLNYLTNSPAYAEAKSFHFDAAPHKIRLSLETSNGPLTVN